VTSGRVNGKNKFLPKIDYFCILTERDETLETHKEADFGTTSGGNAMIRALMLIAGISALQPMLNGAATAQANWPERPITIVIPFPAGSATDVVARLVSREMAKRLGQPVIIENRAGGDGINGTRLAARSDPDGYTVTIGTPSSYAAAPTVHAGSLPYDPVKDFVPISLIGRTPYLLAVSPKLKVKSVNDLVALAKSKPGVLNYSSVGEGSVARIGMLTFALQKGLEFMHIPYNTSAQSVVDLAAGIIDLQLATIPPTLPLFHGGKVNVLAVTSAKRIALLPQIPTMQESGVSDYDITFWLAMFAPSKTPPHIVDRLNAVLRASVETPEVKEALAKQGIEAESNSSQQMAAVVKKDIEIFRDAVIRAGITFKKEKD
jgi:tripartite-type tricarboxylate transporter receptor subunit TctC